MHACLKTAILAKTSHDRTFAPTKKEDFLRLELSMDCIRLLHETLVSKDPQVKESLKNISSDKQEYTAHVVARTPNQRNYQAGRQTLHSSWLKKHCFSGPNKSPTSIGQSPESNSVLFEWTVNIFEGKCDKHIRMFGRNIVKVPDLEKKITDFGLKAISTISLTRLENCILEHRTGIPQDHLPPHCEDQFSMPM